MSPFRRLPAAAAAAIAFVLPAAHAGLNAQEVLQQFNLVVTDGTQTAKSSSHVDGRSYFAGSLDGGVYVGHSNDTPASAYAGLTVRGSAQNLNVDGKGVWIGNRLRNANVNAGGGVVYGGSLGVNFNGSGTPAFVDGAVGATNFNSGRVYSTGANATLAGYDDAADSTDFRAVLGGLSQQLATLTSTGSSVSFSGGKATFTAVANADGLAVFDLTAIDELLFTKGEFAFDLGSATTVIFNTDIESAHIAANFLGGSAQAIGARAIWNFYAAETLQIDNQFGGSVLATEAAFLNKNNIEGGVFVESLDQQGEIHLQPFTGTVPAVPEPGTWALMLGGLAALALAARRRAG